MTADAAIRIVLHSVEGVHFHHNYQYIRQVNPESPYTSMRIFNHNLSITDPSTCTSPLSLASQPRKSSVLGTAEGLIFHVMSFFPGKHLLNPYSMNMVVKEPILRQVNFQLSPTHIRYCGCTAKNGKYRIRTQPSVFIKVIS